MYLLDSSILIELHQYYYPDVFLSFWKQIDKLIEDGKIIALKESQEELRGKEVKNFWNNINIKHGKKFFVELIDDEMEYIYKIEELPIYYEKFGKNKTTLSEEWGFGVSAVDPLLICHGLKHNSTIVTLESPNKGHNIPHVCYLLDVKCIGMKEFLVENNIIA